jgi:hypothetical protein
MMLGAVGPIGIPGDMGAVGPKGPQGPVGPSGVVTCWTYYREFGVGADQSDASRASEIAEFLQRNPSLTLGIDGTPNNNRANVVLASLVSAGVPAAKVQMGVVVDPRYVHPHDGRVIVFFRTN